MRHRLWHEYSSCSPGSRFICIPTRNHSILRPHEKSTSHSSRPQCHQRTRDRKDPARQGSNNPGKRLPRSGILIRSHRVSSHLISSHLITDPLSRNTQEPPSRTYQSHQISLHQSQTRAVKEKFKPHLRPCFACPQTSQATIYNPQPSHPPPNHPKPCSAVRTASTRFSRLRVWSVCGQYGSDVWRGMSRSQDGKPP